MSKIIEEIRNLVVSTPSNQIQQGIWTNEELNNAIVAAYNRGIEDAAKAVKLEKASNYGRYSEDPNPEFQHLGLDVVYQDFYGHGDSGYEAVRVDKDSILKLKI